jgi:hypothetical protein
VPAGGPNFDGLLFAVERLGSLLTGGKEQTLWGYKNDVVALARKSPLASGKAVDIPSNIPFETLYTLVNRARNDALHQGAFAGPPASSAGRPGSRSPQASPRVRRAPQASTSSRSRQAQVAGPSLRGRSPRLDGSARPGVPLSHGSQLNCSPRARWRRNKFSGSGAGGMPPTSRTSRKLV